MKKYILLVSLLCVAVTNVQADKLPNFTNESPSVIVKIGGSPSEKARSDIFTLELETGACDKYKRCYNPFVTQVTYKGEKNHGVGLDYVVKMFKRKDRDALKLSLGIAKFENPLTKDDRLVPHIGLGFEVYTSKTFGVLVSYEQYRGDLTNLDAITIGIHFK